MADNTETTDGTLGRDDDVPASKKAKLTSEPASKPAAAARTRAPPVMRDLKAVLSFHFSGSNQGTKRSEGRVRWFDKEKGFGKIVPLKAPARGLLEAPEEIFVHRKQIEGGPEGSNYAGLVQGALVSYELTTQEDGKPCAGSVQCEGIAKALQTRISLAAGVQSSAKDSQLRNLLLSGLRAGSHQEVGKGKVFMEDRLLEGVGREVGTLGTCSKASACAFFGVFDGHGGLSCSEFVALQLERNVFESLKDQKKRDASSEQVFRSALLAGFKVTEHSFLQYANKLDVGASRAWASSGSTACTACLFGPDEESRLRLLVANAGDSRAVLAKKDGLSVRLSCDHKPDLPAERRRIEQQGGTVAQFGGAWRVILKAGRGHVTSGLSVARSFGDVDFKVPAEIVSAVPDISSFVVDLEDDIALILGSDGIWGSVTDTEAVRIISGPLREGGRDAPERAARLLVETAHARDPSDDKSALVVWFGGAPSEEKYVAPGSAADTEDVFASAGSAGGSSSAVEAPAAIVTRGPGGSDMFEDGTDPVELELLDDIFSAYAKEMTEPDSKASAKDAQRLSEDDAKSKELPKKKGLSNKVAKKVF